MARLARVVAPGYPHHVTQRGKRRQKVFFSRDDYAAYLELTAEPMRCRVLEHWPDWPSYLLGSSAAQLPAQMHRHETTGRPLGSRRFVEKLQALLGRALLPKKRGCEAQGQAEIQTELNMASPEFDQ